MKSDTLKKKKKSSTIFLFLAKHCFVTACEKEHGSWGLGAESGKKCIYSSEKFFHPEQTTLYNANGNHSVTSRRLQLGTK